MGPFFSIVMPTYNQLNLLKKALASIEQQTFNDYEVIIIDNNSNDGTRDYLINKKGIVYKSINNEGVIAKSRNLGIQESKGQWISFLDSDDFWSKNKLYDTFNEIKKNYFNVICNDEWIINLFKNEKKIWSYGPYEKDFYKKLLLFGNRNSTSATSVNKKFLVDNQIKFNEKKEFVTAEDYEFFLHIAFKNGVFRYLNAPLGIHLFHQKSESANYKRLYDAQINVLKHHIFYIQNFEKKNKLWKNVEAMNKIKSNFLKFKKYGKKIYLFYISLLIFLSPINSFYYLVFLFKKFFRQYKLKKIYKLD